jgi:hypothetical protein
MLRVPIMPTTINDNPEALLGLRIMTLLHRQRCCRAPQRPSTCADCGVEGLECWYTGATWGTTLGEACYQVRVAYGQAQPESHVSNA